jgi:hypothetical protein
MVPTIVAELGSFLEAVTGIGPVCLAAEAPGGVAESHGLLGIVPLKPKGDFLMVGLAPVTLAKGEVFFGTRFLGEACLPKEPGVAVFFEAAIAATVLSSALLSSFTAAKHKAGMLSETGRHVHCHLTSKHVHS